MSSISKFIAAAAELKLRDEQFPQRAQVEQDKKAAKDAFRDGYLSYIRQTDPQMIEKVAAFQIQLKAQSLKKKDVLKATRDYISLNCKLEDLPFYTEVRKLNEKGTAVTKMVEWLLKPQHTAAAEPRQISRDEVKALASKFIEARVKIRDTEEGRALRTALNPFDDAIEELALPADQLVAILEEQKTSPYVIMMAKHFAAKL